MNKDGTKDLKRVYNDKLQANVVARKDLILNVMRQLDFMPPSYAVDIFNGLFVDAAVIEFIEESSEFKLNADPTADDYKNMKKFLPTHPDDVEFVNENPEALNKITEEEEEVMKDYLERSKNDLRGYTLSAMEVIHIIGNVLNSVDNESLVIHANMVCEEIIVEDHINDGTLIEISMVELDPTEQLKHNIGRIYS